MADYRKRWQSMHGVQASSRSPFKRKWDTMSTLGLMEKRLRGLVVPKKMAIPSAGQLLRFTPSVTHRSARKTVAITDGSPNTSSSQGSGQSSGLKLLSEKSPRRNGVVRRQYKIRASTADNPELEEYKKSVLAAVSNPDEHRGNSNLQMGPRFSVEQSASTSRATRPAWEDLYEATKMKTAAEDIDREAALLEAKLESLRVTKKEAWSAAEAKRRSLGKEKLKEAEAFTKLSSEAEEAVDDALSTIKRHRTLVMHEQSNIEITGFVVQCLLPGAWLNDEVINLYMELMKERELREPHKFLKCHFFNTFFYNKLFKDKGRYDYRAVKRWTTRKRLGYALADCDKIFVPVHKDIHWCLAIIDLRGKKFEYLDSLKGVDEDVLGVLAKYIVDEVKDKSGEDLDVENWEQDYPDDIPEQKNGCDCGMFMIKYADFHSRGIPLSFSQGDMPYFRRRTVWEILRLKAT